MTQQIINIGISPNDGTGDPLRSAMNKVNQNFTDLYTISNTYTVNTAQLAANIAAVNANFSNYQTTADLAANVLNLSANNTSFVGTVSAANVVSNAQLSGNLAGYQTTAGLSANVFKLVANNVTYVGSMTAVALTGGLFTTTVNSTGFSVGTVFVANSTTLQANGATVNSTGISSNGFVANALGTYVSSNTISLGSSTNAANGFTYLPNGFKLNWGWVSANSSAGNATFTSAYTTNAYSVTATGNNTGNTYGARVLTQNSTVAVIRTGNATSTNVLWMAIGY